ncbi:hypothetical protein DL93DRAFT_2093145 [Clavulina sp. PMI_390]|nr:hypothetical protein DL93DRAFT_2093145 [Clavulina sp. PMI_390]
MPRAPRTDISHQPANPSDPELPSSPVSKRPSARNAARNQIMEGPREVKRERTKDGCITCRMRRKKCETEKTADGSCTTCHRLGIDCLGFGAKRPDWMKDNALVHQKRQEIKEHLVATGQVRGVAKDKSQRKPRGSRTNKSTPPPAQSAEDDFVNDGSLGPSLAPAPPPAELEDGTVPPRPRSPVFVTPRGSPSSSRHQPTSASSEQLSSLPAEPLDRSLPSSSIVAPIPTLPLEHPIPGRDNPRYLPSRAASRSPVLSHALPTAPHLIHTQSLNYDSDSPEENSPKTPPTTGYYPLQSTDAVPSSSIGTTHASGATTYQGYDPGVATTGIVDWNGGLMDGDPHPHTNLHLGMSSSEQPNPYTGVDIPSYSGYGAAGLSSMPQHPASLLSVNGMPIVNMNMGTGVPTPLPMGLNGSVNANCELRIPEMLGLTAGPSSSLATYGAYPMPPHPNSLLAANDGLYPASAGMAGLPGFGLPGDQQRGPSAQDDPELMQMLVPGHSNIVSQFIGPIPPSHMLTLQPNSWQESASQQLQMQQDFASDPYGYSSLSGPPFTYFLSPTYAIHPLPTIRPQQDSFMYYFDRVAPMQYIFDQQSTLTMHAHIRSNPTGVVATAIRMIASMHDHRSRIGANLNPNEGALRTSGTPEQLYHDVYRQIMAVLKRNQGRISEEEATAALHMISFWLFQGGDGKWGEALKIAVHWFQGVKDLYTKNGLGVLHAMSSEQRFAAKTTMWMDIFSGITQLRVPYLNGLYQFVLENTTNTHAGPSFDFFGTANGCCDSVMCSLAAIVTLESDMAQEKAMMDLMSEDERKVHMSIYFARGRAIREILEVKGDCSATTGVEEPRLTEADAWLVEEPVAIGSPEGSTASSGSATSSSPMRPKKSSGSSSSPSGSPRGRSVVHPGFLETSEVFRHAALLYLSTVLNGYSTSHQQTLSAVHDTYHALVSLPSTSADRSLVFPLCMAGCMTDDLMMRNFFSERLQQCEGPVGNSSRTLELMRAVWQKRADNALNGVTTEVRWRDVMRETKLELLLV